MEKKNLRRKYVLSKTALEKARIQCGFETQLDIVESSRHLNKAMRPSKSTIERAFKGTPLLWGTVVKIALVLKVEPETLVEEEIVSSDKEKPGDTNRDKDSLTKSRFFKYLLFGLPACLILLILLESFFSDPHTSKTVDSFVEHKLGDKILGKYRIYIVSNLTSSPIVDKVQNALSKIPSISVLTATTKAENQYTYHAAHKKWNIHAMLSIDIRQGDIFDLVSVQWITANESLPVYAQIVHPTLITDIDSARLSTLSTDISHIVSNFVSSGRYYGQLNLIEAAKLVQDSMDIMFYANTEQELSEVIIKLSTAIELFPNYSTAHALLCEAHALFSWQSDLDESLKKAESACEKAQSLEPQSIYTTIALGHLMGLTGRVNESLSIVRKALEENPRSPKLLLLASQLYNKLGDESSLVYAEQYAKNSIEIEDRNWRAFNELGHISFSRGDILQASNYFKTSIDIKKQETIAANLGTMQLCLGQFEQAKKTYLSIVEDFENNQLAYENLGTIDYLLGDYETALKKKLIAIDMQPEHQAHQVLGALANIYLKLGDQESALENFNKARHLVQNDMLLEPGKETHNLYDFYYFIKVSQLEGDFETNVYQAKYEKLLDVAGTLGLPEKHYLAWIAGEFGDADSKSELWQIISSICPMYLKSPDLL